MVRAKVFVELGYTAQHFPVLDALELVFSTLGRMIDDDVKFELVFIEKTFHTFDSGAIEVAELVRLIVFQIERPVIFVLHIQDTK